jgi:uncharacterized protein (TIGR02594 family)
MRVINWFTSFFKSPAVVVNPVDKSPWLTWLRNNIGQEEIAGSRHNSWIVKLFKYTSYRTNEDETPWCAACMNAALEETGFKGTGSAAAKSFIRIGNLCELKVGALVVISRAPGRFHITCCDDIIDSRHFSGIGGNQSNSLRISVYDRSKIVAVRWPVNK